MVIDSVEVQNYPEYQVRMRDLNVIHIAMILAKILRDAHMSQLIRCDRKYI
jgi:hypothetical protein